MWLLGGGHYGDLEHVSFGGLSFSKVPRNWDSKEKATLLQASMLGGIEDVQRGHCQYVSNQTRQFPNDRTVHINVGTFSFCAQIGQNGEYASYFPSICANKLKIKQLC